MCNSGVYSPKRCCFHSATAQKIDVLDIDESVYEIAVLLTDVRGNFYYCKQYIVFLCAAITCEPLANVRFGRYSNATCSARKMFYNDTCEVTCDFGYVLEGPQVQRCTLEWEWTPKDKGHCESKP